MRRTRFLPDEVDTRTRVPLHECITDIVHNQPHHAPTMAANLLVVRFRMGGSSVLCHSLDWKVLSMFLSC